MINCTDTRKIYSVYQFDQQKRNLNLVDGYKFSCWRPKVGSIIPPGVNFAYGFIYFLFFWLGIFRNDLYIVGIIWKDKRVVHRTIVFPKYYSFPFMKECDVQFGAIYTDEDERGNGLAAYACMQLTIEMASKFRNIWYVADSENFSSNKLAIKSGFIKFGFATKETKLGFFSKYNLISDK